MLPVEAFAVTVPEPGVTRTALPPDPPIEVPASVIAPFDTEVLMAKFAPPLWMLAPAVSETPLLATTPRDTLRLHGIRELISGTTRYQWPDHPARNLTKVGPIEEGFMLKSYGRAPKGAAAEVIGKLARKPAPVDWFSKDDSSR